MHRALEINEANAIPYINKSSGISRKQKTGIKRSRYPSHPNRTVTSTKLLLSLLHLLKISGYATALANGQAALD